MPYQFRQAGAEIQDILDQVGENTTDIAQNAQDIADNAADIASLNSNLTNINSGYSYVNAENTTLASGSWTLVAQTSAKPAGTYLVFATVSFGANATGRRMIGINTNAGSYSANRYTQTQPAVSGYDTRMNQMRFVVLQSEAPLCVYAYQNSGGDLACGCDIAIIKLR